MVHYHVLNAGGTTVGSRERLDEVVGFMSNIAKDEGNYPLLVVSALKRQEGSGRFFGMTDVLHGYRELIRLGELDTTVKAYKTRILDNHMEWLRELGLDDDATLRQDLTSLVTGLTRKASMFRQAPHSPGNNDQIFAYGEWLAIEVISAYIRKQLAERFQGYKTVVSKRARGIDLVTDNEFGNANIEDKCKPWVRAEINAVRKVGHLLVVSGYDGLYKNEVEDGDSYTTTLGRQGSDTTALFIGEALGSASRREETGFERVSVHLLKDVPGVMSGNPKLVGNAFTLSCIDLAIAAHAGNIHEKAIQYARLGNFSTHILDPSRPDKETIIQPKDVPKGIYLVLDPKAATYMHVEGSSDLALIGRILESYEQKGLNCLEQRTVGTRMDLVFDGRGEKAEGLREEFRSHKFVTDYGHATYFKLVGNIGPAERDGFNAFVRRYEPIMDAQWSR